MVLKVMAVAEDSESDVELAEIPASEILNKIQKGLDVEYSNVVVKGDLNIDNLDLPKQNIERTEFQKTILTQPEVAKLVKSKIRITASKIEGLVAFDNIIFEKDIDFWASKFGRNADFSGSQFSGNTKFEESQFNGIVQFNGSQFNGDAHFDSSKFSKFASFLGSQFKSFVYFIKAQFCEDANFGNSQFSVLADFSRSQFNGIAYFDNSRFSDAEFSSQFNQDAFFNRSFFINAGFRSQFNGIVDFTNCTFQEFANFTGAKFIEDAFFNKTKFLGTALFIGAAFNGDFILNDANFGEPFSLERTKYEKLYIRWKDFTKPRYHRKSLENWRRFINLKYEDTSYLLLIENFKNLGFFEDADNCYYQYRIESRRNLPALYKPFDRILWLFYGYGVKPLRPLVWLVILLIAFGLLYSVAGHSPIEAFNTSLTLSLSGTQLIENPNHPANAMQYWIFTSEKLLASLLFAMFLVSVGRTIIR